MDMPPRPKLSSLADGAAEQLFDAELKRCLENIQDPSTKATAARVINLKITLLPDEDRGFMDVEIYATSKLAALKPKETRVHLARAKGDYIGKEQTRPQMPLPGENVQPFPAAVAPGGTPTTS